MWYEVLPCLGIMFSAMTLGMLGTQFVPWMGLNGHRQYKELCSPASVGLYHRDERLHGVDNGVGPYYPKGLETISDEKTN